MSPRNDRRVVAATFPTVGGGSRALGALTRGLEKEIA